MKNELVRCPWPTNEISIRYHDTEWGVPVHDDRLLFEYLILEGAQAGLSWQTVLNKRENYRAAFDNFDAEKIARYNEARVGKLMNNPGIIRNQLKIRSTIQNAKSFLKVQEEFGSFDAYLWRFVDGKPIINRRQEYEGNSSPDGNFRRDEQRSVETWIQICRLDDLLRQHAGHRHGERSSCDVFPAQAALLNFFARR